MFFCPELLRKKRHPFFLVWMAAHHNGSALNKVLTTRKLRVIYLPSVVEEALQIIVANYPANVPKPTSGRLHNFSLYLSAKLMYGSCVVLRKQAALLYGDLNTMFKNLNGLRWSEEKQAIVRYVKKKAKSKQEKKGDGYKQLAELSVNECIDEDFNLIVSVDEDAEPLVFSNSVPESAITMTEQVPFSSREENLCFGDEGTDMMLLHFGVDESEQRSLIDRITPTDIPHPTEENGIPEENLNEIQLEIPTDLTSIEGLATEDERRQSPGRATDCTAAVLSLESDLAAPRISPVTSTMQSDPQPIPPNEPQPGSLRDVTSSVHQQSPQMEPLQSPQREKVGNLTPGSLFQDLEEIGRQMETSRDAATSEAEPLGIPEEQREQLELSSIVEEPQIRVHRHQKKTRLIVDNITEIPSNVFSDRITNKAQDTLKQSAFHDYMTSYATRKWSNLDAMKLPGRGAKLNRELMKLFIRNFVTDPVADETDISLLEVIRTESTHHEVSKSRYEESSVPCVEHSSIAGPHTSLLHYTPEPTYQIFAENFMDNGHQTPPRPKRIRIDSAQDQQVDTEVLLQGESIPIQQDFLYQALPRRGESIEQIGSSLAGNEESLAIEDGALVPTGSMTDGRVDSLKRHSYTDEGKARKKSRKSPVKEVESVRGGTEVSVTTQPAQSLEAQPQTVQEESGVGLADYFGPPEMIYDPLTGMESEMPVEQIDSGNDKTPPSVNEEQECSLTSQSLLVEPEDVLSKITALAEEMNTDTISMDYLCPPTTTRRNEAAKTFFSLLELHKDKKINLTQVHLDYTVEPVMITIKKSY